MKVRTITGGFRGLGALSVSQRDAVRLPFVDRVQDFTSVYVRFVEAYDGGLVRQGDIPLLHQADTVHARIGEMLEELERLETEPALAEWQVIAGRLASDAEKMAKRMRFVLGDEAANRGFRTVLLAAGSIALFGGVGWVAWKSLR